MSTETPSVKTPVLRCKSGVIIGNPAPAGFRLLGALERTCRALGRDLTITCGKEKHGPKDPHTLGEAYDVRTHDLTQKQKAELIGFALSELTEDPEEILTETAGGLASRKFFGFLEAKGTANEHAHFQRRRGKTYP